MAKVNEATAFLTNIWKKQCRTGDYVFLCTKDPKNKTWKDHAIKYSKDSIKNDVKQVIRKYSPDRFDVYFCPLPFTEPVRDKNLVRRSKFLWQDLDYADPKKFSEELQPSIYWESSPGRYHGLWELDKPCRNSRVTEIESLNRDLAYQIGADKGGWDLTQVLRIPGTRNHKYDDKPIIKMKLEDGKVYPFSVLRSKVKEHQKFEVQTMEPLEEGDPQRILEKWSSKLPRTILTLLLQERVPVGERSDTIWYLENKLYEVGLTPEEIFTLIKHSNWNKYKGRHDENERLQKELEKIISEAGTQANAEQLEKHEGIEIDADGVTLKVDSYQELMGNISSKPGWLVEGFWARRSHGIVAGEPKSFKSTYITDLAVSVASGKPFLGKYPVLEPGPVIYVQNENAEWIMKDKIEKLIANRELQGMYRSIDDRTVKVNFPKDLPLYTINQQGYLLNDPIHQRILEELIKEIKPVLVIFDPLYLMFDGDVNSAKELNPVLNWMLKIKNEYKTGVIAIHHYNKGSGTSKGYVRGGQRMLGSTTLHGWIESAWYLQRTEADEDDDAEIDKQSKRPSPVILDREFRNAGAFPKLQLDLLMGELGNPVYSVNAEVYKEEGAENQRRSKDAGGLAEEIESVLENMKKGDVLLDSKLIQMTGHSKKKVKEAIDIVITPGNPKYKRIKKGIKVI